MGFPSFKLSRTGCEIGLSGQICEWQDMQVYVGGIPADDEVSTDVWQYRQSIPSPRTWCSWLNGTGCSSTTPCWVWYGDFMIMYVTTRRPTAANAPPKIVNRESVLVLGWKIYRPRLAVSDGRAAVRAGRFARSIARICRNQRVSLCFPNAWNLVPTNWNGQGGRP